MQLNRAKLRKILYIAIAVFVLLVFFSRTIYTYHLPRVTVVLPSSGRMNQELEGYGEIRFARTYDIYANAGGKVDTLYVKEKETIQANTPIAVLDLEAIEDQREALNFQLRKLENSLAALEIDRTALEREIRNLESEEDDTVPDDEMQWELDRLETQAARQEEEYRNNKVLFEVGALPKADLDKSEKDWQDTMAQVQQQKNKILQAAAEEDRKKGLSEKEKDTLRAQKKKDLEKNRLSIEDVKLEIENNRMEFDKIQSVTPEDRFIYADEGGVVIKLLKQKNSYVSKGEAIASIGIMDAQFELDITATVEQGKFIESGDAATVKVGGREWPATVTGIKVAGEQLTITVSFPGEGFNGGEYARVFIQKQSEHYDYIIPNESIHNDGLSYYVWQVASQDTFWGKEYYVTQRRIWIDYKTEFTTALAQEYTGDLGPIVKVSDKELSHNMRVVSLE